MEAISQFIADYGTILVEATGASLFMTCISCVRAYVIGLPIGVAFHITTQNGLHPNKAVNVVLGREKALGVKRVTIPKRLKNAVTIVAH